MAPAAQPGRHEGGCLCAAVRYVFTGAPLSSGLCHCRSCRRACGATRVAWLVLPGQALRFTRGTPAEWRSSPEVVRSFCARCGSPLTYRHADSPDTVDLTTGSLDVPDAFPPTREIWLGHKVAWEAPDPARAHFEGEHESTSADRPGTDDRGRGGGSGDADESARDGGEGGEVRGPPVDFSELLNAFESASVGLGEVHRAYVDRETGHCVQVYDGGDERDPRSADDGLRYLALPHKNLLDLGRRMALDFADAAMAPADARHVHDVFHRRGAWGRFKDLLADRGLLDEWRAHEARATERALRRWCREQGIAVTPAAAAPAPVRHRGG